MYALAIDYFRLVGYGLVRCAACPRLAGRGLVQETESSPFPLGLEAVLVTSLESASDEFISTLGRRGRPRRRSQLIALAGARCLRENSARVAGRNSRRNSISVRRRFACQIEVALEYLVGAAADLDVGAVAVECLIVLRDSRFAV